MSSPSASNTKRSRLSASRLSLSSRKSLQGGQSSLPRPSTAVHVNRLTSTQPTYDFLTGISTVEPAPALSRATFRQSEVNTQDIGHNENLRAQINSLKYELENVQQERSLLTLQHERELRDLQSRAEADFKKAQAAESATKKAARRNDILARELQDAQNQGISEKASLEKQVRHLQEQNQLIREDAADAQANLSDQDRQHKYQINDIETKCEALQQTVDHVKNDMQLLSQNLEAAQEKLSRRDVEVERLEAQVLELKSHIGDSETLSVLQRELSNQVTHIRTLESASREQLVELRRLRNEHKSVQVVEEQKRSLETELHVLKDVHRQLGEAQIHREILEDEKKIWTTLLERDGQEPEFDTPESVVRALVQERIEHASSVDRLGKVEAELFEKDGMLDSLESEKAALKEAADRARTASSSDAPNTKAYKRVDRQRLLAVKELEYLRAQLKTFDTEETILASRENFDAQKVQHIQELELLVDQYRAEIQALHNDLSKREEQLKIAQQTSAPDSMPTPTIFDQSQPQSSNLSQQLEGPRGTKRPAADTEDSSQLGHILRKNKNLQTALAAAMQKQALLNTELSAAKSQIQSLTSKSRTRILELRSNPTADAEALKISTLAALKAENKDLLLQLRSIEHDQNQDPGARPIGPRMVPASVVDNLKLDLQEMEKVIAEKEKRMRRLKEIWTNKATEFRDLIVSVLGYKVDFMPNGKVRVTPTYYLNQGRDDRGDGDGAEHSIIFDGENGTMKISGGPRSQFALEIKDLVKFWVQEKGQIPCFLAALTLECFDKNTRAVSGL